MTVAKVWDGAAWVPIVGAQGPQGIQGPQGPQGPAGPSTPIPVVTALPAGPVDGQEVYYNTGGGTATLWRLRYTAGWPDGYGWMFVGGAPLRHEIDTTETINSATYVNAATPGPLIAATLAGYFVAEYGMMAQPSAVAAANLSASLAWSDGVAVDADNIAIQTPTAAAILASVARKRLVLTATPAELRLKYRQGVAAAGASVLRRYLYLTPARVK